MSLLDLWEKAVVYVDTVDCALLESNKQAPEITFELGKRRPRPQPATQLWKSLKDIHVLYLTGAKTKPEVQALLRKWVRYHRLGWKVGFRLTEEEATRFLKEVIETSEVAATVVD